MLLHVFGQRPHINLGSGLVAAGARLRLTLPAKQRPHRYIEQRARLLKGQPLFLFVRKHLLAETEWIGHLSILLCQIMEDWL